MHMPRDLENAFPDPFQFCGCYGIVVCGRMAEWSIAAVLKTAGLTAPGVRIPLLPSRGRGYPEIMRQILSP